jgi:hypothetical protein
MMDALSRSLLIIMKPVGDDRFIPLMVDMDYSMRWATWESGGIYNTQGKT